MVPVRAVREPLPRERGPGDERQPAGHHTGRRARERPELIAERRAGAPEIMFRRGPAAAVSRGDRLIDGGPREHGDARLPADARAPRLLLMFQSTAWGVGLGSLSQIETMVSFPQLVAGAW